MNNNIIVGLTGAFCDNNFGDYTMLLNNVFDLFDSNHKIKKIILFCYDKTFVDVLVKDYFDGLNVEVFEVKSTIEFKDQNAFFGIDHTDELFTPMEILYSISNIQDLRNKVKETDVMISNGGGYYDYYWLGLKRRYKLFSIVAPLIIARQQQKKVVTLGNSYGPWGKNDEFFFGLFNYIQFDAIDCRDSLYSPKYLKSISVTDNVYEVCDDLVYINDRIRRRTTSSNYNGYYILDIYCSIQEIEHNIDKIVYFVASVRKKENLTPVFVAHGPDYNGTRQAELLKKYIPELIIYQSDKQYLPTEDFLALLKGASFVLCEHYHSFVLSSTNGVPAIMFVRKIDGSYFYYYNKTVGFIKTSGILNDSDADESLFCVTTLPDLFNSSESLWAKITKIRSLLNNRKFENKKLAYINNIILE